MSSNLMLFEMFATFQNVRIGFVPESVVALVVSHLSQHRTKNQSPKKKLQKKT